MIGCGEHAESSHGPAQARYAAAHVGTDLAACCDLDAARAERHRQRFGFARAYTDVTAMLDAEKPDAAVLAVPVHRSASVAAPLLERGVPLLLEKPPGRTVQEVDALMAAADRGGRGTVPHQVAFNRRFVPVVQEARRRLIAIGAPAAIQHVHYEMTRVDRRDPDFSTTAIHGLDAVRFLAGADYAEARLRYREQPALGPGDANIFVDAVLTSGATAHHLAGDHLGGASDACVLGGFYGEYEAFLGDLAAGRTPSPSLRESRQSVEIAACVRRRDKEFRA